jgi:hypothetical protein
MNFGELFAAPVVRWVEKGRLHAMFRGQFLTAHSAIQSWVADQNGCPAVARVRDHYGDEKAQLRLKFMRFGDEEALDGETSPCSWKAWLAELDRQQLALKIEPTGDFSLVPRNTMH